MTPSPHLSLEPSFAVGNVASIGNNYASAQGSSDENTAVEKLNGNITTARVENDKEMSNERKAYCPQLPVSSETTKEQQQQLREEKEQREIDVVIEVREGVEEEQNQTQTEEQESIELARRLMAEEAMLSYQQHVELLHHQENAAIGEGELSAEDYAAVQAALMNTYHVYQDDAQELLADSGDFDDDDQSDGDGDGLSYEALLHLSERIGDVKAERWAMVAKKEISKLESFRFQQRLPASNETSNGHDDDTERMCLVCQCDYEEGELLRRLPCGHCFHAPCCEQWLMEKDVCPYCRQTILPDE